MNVPDVSVQGKKDEKEIINVMKMTKMVAGVGSMTAEMLNYLFLINLFMLADNLNCS